MIPQGRKEQTSQKKWGRMVSSMLIIKFKKQSSECKTNAGKEEELWAGEP